MAGTAAPEKQLRQKELCDPRPTASGRLHRGSGVSPAPTCWPVSYGFLLPVVALTARPFSPRHLVRWKSRRPGGRPELPVAALGLQVCGPASPRPGPSAGGLGCGLGWARSSRRAETPRGRAVAPPGKLRWVTRRRPMGADGGDRRSPHRPQQPRPEQRATRTEVPRAPLPRNSTS